jgi:cation diffusion facilitator CzcD-associated flavoprotein CzcO
MSMTGFTNTIIVGAGQAGLAVSHYLTKLSVDHLVLEQADGPGDAWRNHRWDSFTLNTPTWQSRLPGVQYGEDDSDGFMPKQEVVAHFEELARRLPVRYRARQGDRTEVRRIQHRARQRCDDEGAQRRRGDGPSSGAKNPAPEPEFSATYQTASFR